MHTQQSTGFSGRMRTQTRPWEQHFTSVFLSITCSNCPTLRHILISTHLIVTCCIITSLHFHTCSDWPGSCKSRTYYCTHHVYMYSSVATPPSLYCLRVMFCFTQSCFFCCVYCITISYSHTKFQLHNLPHLPVMCTNIPLL